MLFDELQDQLKALEPDIRTIKEYWAMAGLATRFIELEALSHKENFWQNPEQATIMQELQRIRTLTELYKSSTQSHSELGELIELFQQVVGRVLEFPMPFGPILVIIFVFEGFK